MDRDKFKTKSERASGKNLPWTGHKGTRKIVLRDILEKKGAVGPNAHPTTGEALGCCRLGKNHSAPREKAKQWFNETISWDGDGGFLEKKRKARCQP